MRSCTCLPDREELIKSSDGADENQERITRKTNEVEFVELSLSREPASIVRVEDVAVALVERGQIGQIRANHFYPGLCSLFVYLERAQFEGRVRSHK
jgi:hypothetical protein